MNVELRQDMEISWRMQPLLLVEGAEVLQRMTRASPEGQDLNKDYIEVRDILLDSLFGVIGAAGRNKAGKGSMLMGFYRAFKQDELFKDELKKRGIEEFDIVPVLFVQAREAAQLSGTGRDGAPLIPHSSTLPYADWKYAHPRKISKFQWSFVDKYFPFELDTPEKITEYLRERKKAVLFLTEGSAPLVRPLSIKEKDRRSFKEGSPIVVRGRQDLGFSVLGNIAVDPRFKNNCKLYFVMKDAELRDDEASNNFRRNPTFGPEEEIKVVVTVDGREYDLAELPEEEQQKYSRVLTRSMASLELVEQLDSELDAFEETQYRKDVIHSPSDEGLFGFLSGSLGNSNFRRVLNPQFRGRKTYDLEYLKQGVIYRSHPRIYPELPIPL